MTIRWEPKRANEVRDYTHDWSLFLVDDTIATNEVTVTGATKDSDSILSGNQAIKVILSGGVDGSVATITNTITTAAGRTETETFVLPIGTNDEPISLSEAKDHLRVSDDSEDNYILSLIPAARRYVENRSGLVIKRRQFTERHLPKYGAILLTQAPIVSIDSIDYKDTDQADAQYTDARFFFGSSIIFPALAGSWPVPYSGELFSITYTAGLSAADLATDDYSALVHAMKLLMGHWYGQRESVSERAIKEVPLATDALCDQVRAVFV